jgi:phosphate transport system permease protein
MTARRRKAEEAVVKTLMIVSLGAVLAALAAIIVVILIRGAAALNISMLIQTPKGGYYLGREGGIANAIVGSFYLAGGGILLAMIFGLPIAFALQREYGGKWLSRITRLTLDILWGTPSIVYGAFGFIIMCYFGIRASLLGGIIVLALLMMPIMTRAIEEIIQMVPIELREISYALGATRCEVSCRVILRQILPAIVTAVLLAFGRGIGDAASILFVAGYSDRIPRSLMDPVASLPLAVFFQIGTPIPEVQQRAYASAFVLLVIVLLVSMTSRVASRCMSRYVVR